MATRLPSGSYRTQVFVGYSDKGRRQYKSFTADTAKKADLLALQWQAEHPSARLSGMTLGRAVSSYIRGKNSILSPSTLRSYCAMERTLKNDYSQIMRKKMDVISASDMQGFINEMSRVSSPKTVRNYYGLLGAVYKSQGMTIPFAPCLRR